MRNRFRSPRFHALAVCLAVGGLAFVAPVVGGELPADDDTRLLLRFDGNLTGVGGEMPDGPVLAAACFAPSRNRSSAERCTCQTPPAFEASITPSRT